ncbi:hypothetical protein QJQ45_006012 [Haematococcus lacustris]|nr:hypothetical protein QJQ45_030451 [Haematococcus lacustris]KAJ9513458.1 hypothetical protein QJQ45_006012 [Haematococcus lacustris]
MLSKLQSISVKARRVELARDITRPKVCLHAQRSLVRLRVAAPQTEEAVGIVQPGHGPRIPVLKCTEQQAAGAGDEHSADVALQQLDRAIAERRARRKREQLSYQAAAIAASIGVSGIAIFATYLRFAMHMTVGGAVPWVEVAGTLLLVVGGALGMEMYARYAHKAIWHESPLGWLLHKSHHTPRTGPFEANDLFAIINGLPAMLLCTFGFWLPNVLGAACFGAGLGITLYGMAYMFVHDGLVHRRFPTGPIAGLPYMKRLTVAHQLHHSGKYGGAPWGMFLGPQELQHIPGAAEEVERLVLELDWSKR